MGMLQQTWALVSQYGSQMNTWSPIYPMHAKKKKKKKELQKKVLFFFLIGPRLFTIAN